jgi:hypothetical protein
MKKVTKWKILRFFLLFFVLMEGSGSAQIMTGIRIRKAEKHTDPQLWQKV